ncbi:Hypothetical protein, putative [Bodo saltans]|uniref:Uncharacterized protein n=1 Tax=Bodo saltans TaxID=75058 RepID=A0A0S4J5M3_BODSA|nr:Hypothetical protein, putative [Bodo saltans]|eukprot:CUG58031.1 Hypothetical protein, putative [Bodo saltans]
MSQTLCMASPAEYEAPTVVIRDAYAVMFEGWSPSELHLLDPHLMLLREKHDPITVAGKNRLLLRPSLCATPFDVMHTFFDPHSQPFVSVRSAALEAPCLQVIVHAMGAGERPQGGAGQLLATRGSMYNGKTSHLDPFQQLFIGSASEVAAAVERSTGHVLALLQVQLFIGSASEVAAALAAAQNGSSQGKYGTESWFRIVSDCGLGRRRFVVERSTGHVLALLQALRFSFPHLAVPFIGEVTSTTVAVVLDFAARHCESMNTYLPLLYFLFEQNFKAYHHAMNSLTEQVKQYSQLNERCFQQAKKPQKTGWFGWSSSSTPPPPAPNGSASSGANGAGSDEGYDSAGIGGLSSLKEEVDYAEKDERIGKHLPHGFRARYADSCKRHALMSDVLQNAHQLERCLTEEGEAMERLAEALTELQATLTDDFIPSLPLEVTKPVSFVDPCVSTSSPSSSRDPSAISPSHHSPRTTVESPTTSPLIELAHSTNPDASGPLGSTTRVPPPLREVNKVLKQFITVCAVLQNQVAIPLATGLCGAAGEAEVHAMTRRQFLRSMIHYAKFVQDKEGLVTGKEDIRDTPAAANPAIMAKIKDVYAKRRTTLRSQKQQMNEELRRVDAMSRSSLLRVCTIVASLFHHVTDALDARHYQGLVMSASQSFDRSLSASRRISSTPNSPQTAGSSGSGSSSFEHPITVLLADVPSPATAASLHH